MRFTPIAVAAALLLSVTGCTQTVSFEAATNAIDPLCASVVVHLPDTVSNLEKRETNSQGTGAWGNPADVLLRCGVDVPDPTSTLPCVTADGIDWLRDDSDAPNYVFTTYGRDPAVEVIINDTNVSPGPSLQDLSAAVSFTEKVSECTSIEDSLN